MNFFYQTSYNLVVPINFESTSPAEPVDNLS